MIIFLALLTLWCSSAIVSSKKDDSQDRNNDRTKNDEDSCVEKCHRFLPGTYRDDQRVGAKWIQFDRKRVNNFLESAKLFDAYCERYNETAECLNDCPDSREKKRFQLAISSLQKTCARSFSSVRNENKCYGKTQKKCRNECDWDADQLDDALDQADKPIRDLSVKEIGQLNREIETICQNTHCMIVCTKTETWTKCGPPHASLQGNLGTLPLEILKSRMNETGKLDGWPRYCDKVISEAAVLKEKYKSSANFNACVGSYLFVTVGLVWMLVSFQ